MIPLLYSIPAGLAAQVASGQVQLFGAILKDSVSGQIVGHVQQTGLLTQMLSGAAGIPVFQPLHLAANLVGDGMIMSKLSEMSETLNLLQVLQIGSLAVSGVGLGVSVAGFAMVMKRLNAIEEHLTRLDQRIEAVTAERRSDDLRRLFGDITTALDDVETLSLRRRRTATAEASQRQLAICAGQLEVHFRGQADRFSKGRVNEADLDALWSVAAAIRLCHEAGSRALFQINELSTASSLASRQAQRFLELSRPLSPDGLTRRIAAECKTANEFASVRRAANPAATTLVRGLRESVAAIISQSALAADLSARNISGADYLASVEQMTDVPLVYLPVAGQGR
jgi:hypothetical protein